MSARDDLREELEVRVEVLEDFDARNLARWAEWAGSFRRSCTLARLAAARADLAAWLQRQSLEYNDPSQRVEFAKAARKVRQ